MAVAIEMRFSGATLAQYDEVMRLMDLGDSAPDGALFHWVAATEDGIKVVDVWETMDQFNTFASDTGRSSRRIGFNAECPNLLIQRRLNESIDNAIAETGAKIHLIGHSLGGIIARAVAGQRPNDIASVTTLGSPFRGTVGSPHRPARG